MSGGLPQLVTREVEMLGDPVYVVGQHTIVFPHRHADHTTGSSGVDSCEFAGPTRKEPALGFRIFVAFAIAQEPDNLADGLVEFGGRAPRFATAGS